MGKGVFCPFPAVAAPANDFFAPDDDAAHRHFPLVKGFLRKLQRFFHKQLVQTNASFALIIPMIGGDVKDMIPHPA